ncbi:MAG: hypothetical protein ACJA2S_001767, partial [Cyclobacteriaceae bacterium]
MNKFKSTLMKLITFIFLSLTLLSSCQNNRKIDKKIVETEKPDD